jgi:GDP-L-fucose synthase
MNIFITGSSGFIGSHLKEYLNNTYPSYTIYAPTSSELNLYNETDVDEYISHNRIDIIIHLANRGGGRNTLDMKNITEYNLRIFFNLVKHSLKVKKIISFGSGAEYGKHKPIIDAKEDDYQLALPLDEYGFYKSITSQYIEKTDNMIQLRIFGCYGEYEDYRYKFISNAIVKNLLHLPITINQNVYFDYIYIADLLNIIDWFMHHDTKEKIYNASTGIKIDLLTLANYINQISDYQSEIVVLNEGLNNEYTSNNNRLMQEFNFKFQPHINSIESMKRYFETNLNNLDIEIVKNDPFLCKIQQIWKGK